MSRSWIIPSHIERGGRRQSYQEIQIAKATLVASPASSRKSRGLDIPRRSSSYGRRDSDVDDLDVLVRNRGRKYVREVRMVKAKECDAEKDREEAEAYG
jgi:hypothetical protein